MKERRSFALILRIMRLIAILTLLLVSTGLAQSKMPEAAKIVYGKIQVVDSFPDYKVKVVTSFPDLKVQKVGAFPDAPGKWQMVDSFPDFKIQFVDSFPDFTIEWVDSFPGPTR